MHHTSVISHKTTGEEPWYAAWFDSPYYPMLYKQRDEYEARAFIDHLLEAWQPPAAAKLLDLSLSEVSAEAISVLQFPER